MAADKLPKFKAPPVVETVLGVQFDPIGSLCNAHLGAFWRELQEDWPNVVDVSPLPSQFEQFGKGKTWQVAGLQLKLSQDVNTRLQIRNRANDRMIQIQNGRLHFNWLGRGGNEYPSYEKVRPEFDWTLDIFQRFLAELGLEDLRPNQWEVTYVNHIPRETVWNDVQDWVGLLPLLTPLPSKRATIRLESFGGEWHYEIEPQRGRLHVNLTHGFRKRPDEQEILVLNLTARGPVGENGGAAATLDEGLAIGHETIVRSFVELTSESAHQYWGLIDDENR